MVRVSLRGLTIIGDDGFVLLELVSSLEIWQQHLRRLQFAPPCHYTFLCCDDAAIDPDAKKKKRSNWNNVNKERLREEAPTTPQTLGTRGLSFLPPPDEGNLSTLTPNRYRRLFNDPRFSPLTVNPGVLLTLIITGEAFFGLTHQV
ncbi:hypothetical protein B296_00000704 [Ensete ventricosum]|uniref:Uncharacterized protein n=1 Tax=Ensete ventricosum TaxID=4639 RepID=A0A427B8V2_ENSVE|nr:hypothetical protein B296_00000704 [Ensete ventricosum]